MPLASPSENASSSALNVMAERRASQHPDLSEESRKEIRRSYRGVLGTLSLSLSLTLTTVALSSATAVAEALASSTAVTSLTLGAVATSDSATIGTSAADAVAADCAVCAKGNALAAALVAGVLSIVSSENTVLADP